MCAISKHIQKQRNLHCDIPSAILLILKHTHPGCYNRYIKSENTDFLESKWVMFSQLSALDSWMFSIVFIYFLIFFFWDLEYFQKNISFLDFVFHFPVSNYMGPKLLAKYIFLKLVLYICRFSIYLNQRA